MGEAQRAEAAQDSPKQDESGIKPFGAWLHEQRNGSLHAELGEHLADITARVIELQKAGSVTLTVKIAPTGEGQNSVFITDDVKAKPPEPPRPKALFFSDSKGNLSRRDPRQAELPIRDVSADTSAPRDL
jgi:hypothetical protein